MPDPDNLLPTSNGDKDSKRAARISIHMCGHCPHIHIALHDDTDAIYADFVLGADQMDWFIETCLATLLAISTYHADKMEDKS